jgi:hypothetical protein
MVSNIFSNRLVTRLSFFFVAFLAACSLALPLGLGGNTYLQSLEPRPISADYASYIAVSDPITFAIPSTYSGFVEASELQGVDLSAWQVAPDLPDPQMFITYLYNGQSDVIRGVFIEDVLALPVVQQPEDNLNYVSDRLGVLTQFQMAAEFGITGLLAHNNLSGEDFLMLQPDQEVWVIYGDKTVSKYRVSEIATFQKLKPLSLQSDYLDLSTDLKLSTSDMFRRFYRGEHHLVFQTCLEKDGLLNWGLLFVTALPIDG